MKGLRLVLVAAGVLGLAACSKGSAGKPGDPGPVGTIGQIAPAPQIQFVSLPYVTRNAIVTVYGQNLAATTGSNGEVAVLVGGYAADVLASDAQSVTFTHAIPASPTSLYSTLPITVQVNNQSSNVLAIQVAPSGTALGLGLTVVGLPFGMTIAANGDLIAVDALGFVDRITPAGDASNVFLNFDPGTNFPRSVWSIGTDYWTFDFNGNLDKYDASGNPLRVAALPGAVAGAWDKATTPNFYALHSNGVIDKWDATTHVVTFAWATATNGGNPNPLSATSFTFMVDGFYVADAANSAIVKVGLADQLTTLYLATGVANPSALSNDGTNLILVANGVIAKVDNTPAVSTFSALKWPGTPFATAVDATGKVFVDQSPSGLSAGIGRYAADGLTLEPWATLSFGDVWSLAANRLFTGSNLPALLGSPDVKSGVLYEVKLNGTLHRVGALPQVDSDWIFGSGRVNVLDVAGTNLWLLDKSNGNIVKINMDTGVASTFLDNVAVPTIDAPQDLTIDATGKVYVACQDPATSNETIAQFDTAGALLNITFGESPFGNPIPALTVQGNRLVGFSQFDDQLFSLPLTGGTGIFVGNPAGNDPSQYVRTNYLTVDPSGNVNFVDRYNGNPGPLMRLSSAGAFDVVVNAPGDSLQFIVTDANGTIWSDNFGTLVVLP